MLDDTTRNDIRVAVMNGAAIRTDVSFAVVAFGYGEGDASAAA